MMKSKEDLNSLWIKLFQRKSDAFPDPTDVNNFIKYELGYFNTEPKSKVLEYSENFQGWSDDLTKIHDSFGDHPIDLYSRWLAIQNIKKFFSSGFSLLEIGCSSGNYLNVFNPILLIVI